MAGISNLSEARSVNTIAHGMDADRRGTAVHRRHLVDERLDLVWQSTRFACKCGTQQPIGYFLANSRTTLELHSTVILNWTGHEVFLSVLGRAPRATPIRLSAHRHQTNFPNHDSGPAFVQARVLEVRPDLL